MCHIRAKITFGSLRPFFSGPVDEVAQDIGGDVQGFRALPIGTHFARWAGEALVSSSCSEDPRQPPPVPAVVSIDKTGLSLTGSLFWAASWTAWARSSGILRG